MPDGKPLTIGVFGGSFNPIHLGHALLAITTQQTKPVDQVVLVPVYRHAVKTNLMPYEDRVNMCRLACANNPKIVVSTVEERVGASNGAMLRALKEEYPPGTKLIWICGDDFFRWMKRPKGLETIDECSGLIVQRRLHKSHSNQFFQEPIDEANLRTFLAERKLSLDFIYGELPHFSSTLVRKAPGHWRSFLTQSIAQYLEERPHLLEQLMENLREEAPDEAAAEECHRQAADCVLRGLELVHTLQRERGRTALALSTQAWDRLQRRQSQTDALLQTIHQAKWSLEAYPEVGGLAHELDHAGEWLKRDREILLAHRDDQRLVGDDRESTWLSRWSLVSKVNTRIDVLTACTMRALSEILDDESKSEQLEVLERWCHAKEALGRLRAFVCSGGPGASSMVRESLKLRQKVHDIIEEKDRRISTVGWHDTLKSDAAPKTLQTLLENVTLWEWSLLGSFAASTPLERVHKLLAGEAPEFDVDQFFEASSSAIDYILTFSKALSATLCAEDKPSSAVHYA